MKKSVIFILLLLSLTACKMERYDATVIYSDNFTSLTGEETVKTCVEDSQYFETCFIADDSFDIGDTVSMVKVTTESGAVIHLTQEKAMTYFNAYMETHR